VYITNLATATEYVNSERAVDVSAFAGLEGDVAESGVVSLDPLPELPIEDLSAEIDVDLCLPATIISHPVNVKRCLSVFNDYFLFSVVTWNPFLFIRPPA
jgi:hypothetical protein